MEPSTSASLEKIVRGCLPLVVVNVVVAPAADARGQMSFQEKAGEVGLVAVHSPAIDAVPGVQEQMIGGMAVGDFNGDGLQDLFWASGGLIPDKLFINQGGATFADEAAAWGLTDLHCGNGVAVGDYNNDTWPDIYVSSFGDPASDDGEIGKNRLYRNDAGTGFTEVAVDAGVNITSPTASNGYGAAWGDIDLDGDLDLAVTTWRTGAAGASDGNRLYQNNGDGTFTNVTIAAIGTALDDVRGFQPAFADMNGDQYPEIVWIGDFYTSRYLVNNTDGTFTDMTMPAGMGLDANGMGVAIGDVDNDGLYDVYVSSIFDDNEPKGHNNGNMLYMGLGNHVFDEQSEERGTLDGGWAWGTVAVDLDQDTWQDIVSTNGWDAGQWFGEMTKLFHNDGDGTFTERAGESGLTHSFLGRCIVYMDAENDGDMDIVIASHEESLEYDVNDSVTGGFLRLLFDTTTNPQLAPDGFQTRTETVLAEQTLHHYMHSSPSYLGTSEQTIHVGLGDAVIVDELRIIWARGQMTVLQDVAVNQHLTITAPVQGDVNPDGTDGVVDVVDLLYLLAQWGPADSTEDLAVDLDGDGMIAVTDLLVMLANWG